LLFDILNLYSYYDAPAILFVLSNAYILRYYAKLFTILSTIKIIVGCKYTIFYWINR